MRHFTGRMSAPKLSYMNAEKKQGMHALCMDVANLMIIINLQAMWVHGALSMRCIYIVVFDFFSLLLLCIHV